MKFNENTWVLSFMQNQFLRLDNVSKSYSVGSDKKSLHVLTNISLSVEKGSFTSFFGPNGCGKSTLLQIVAGILKPDEGTIHFTNNDKTKISFVFQNFSETLFPWKSCLDNIAFPLELQGMEQKVRQEKVRSFVEKMDLRIPLGQYPYQCSGGQKQLVAIARALINDPDILLMDEPFVALDYVTRISMENKLLDIWQKTKVTTLFVSHDIDEAVYLSDKVVVFNKRPTRIMNEIPIDIPRPREQKIIESKEFLDTKTKILHCFYEVMK